jgi:hypothetical protein
MMTPDRRSRLAACVALAQLFGWDGGGATLEADELTALEREEALARWRSGKPKALYLERKDPSPHRD